MKNDEKIIFKFKKGKQADLINTVIEKAGSQRKLSKFIDIPKGSISSYKAEKYLISTKRLTKILRFLNLKIEDILDLIEKELPEHWGQKIAAKKFIEKFSKKELHDHMKYIRSFKKKANYNLKLPLTCQFCEFFGILIGDGCVSKYKDFENADRCDVIITGDKRYEYGYYLYIKSLLKENFDINCYINKSRTTNNLRLTIRNKQFSNFILKIGYPFGKKSLNIVIPTKLLNLEWNKLRYLIKGIFDTDGTTFGHKRENYRYPYIGISTKSQKLLQQLYIILRKRGYPVYINNDNLFMKGIKNVKRWMDDVGTSNPKHKFKYRYWLIHGKLPARLLTGR